MQQLVSDEHRATVLMDSHRLMGGWLYTIRKRDPDKHGGQQKGLMGLLAKMTDSNFKMGLCMIDAPASRRPFMVRL